MTEQNNKDDPTLKPNPPSVINTVDKKRAEARNNYARAAFETSNFWQLLAKILRGKINTSNT